MKITAIPNKFVQYLHAFDVFNIHKICQNDNETEMLTTPIKTLFFFSINRWACYRQWSFKIRYACKPSTKPLVCLFVSLRFLTTGLCANLKLVPIALQSLLSEANVMRHLWVVNTTKAYWISDSIFQQFQCDAKMYWK